jgi:hypothetical protein
MPDRDSPEYEAFMLEVVKKCFETGKAQVGVWEGGRGQIREDAPADPTPPAKLSFWAMVKAKVKGLNGGAPR